VIAAGAVSGSTPARIDLQTNHTLPGTGSHQQLEENR
jgi:hypothetical protein